MWAWIKGENAAKYAAIALGLRPNDPRLLELVPEWVKVRGVPIFTRIIVLIQAQYFCLYFSGLLHWKELPSPSPLIQEIFHGAENTYRPSTSTSMGRYTFSRGSRSIYRLSLHCHHCFGMPYLCRKMITSHTKLILSRAMVTSTKASILVTYTTRTTTQPFLAEWWCWFKRLVHCRVFFNHCLAFFSFKLLRRT